MRSMLKVKGSGESSLPPLLFVHGAWHGAWCWKPLMDYLAKKGFTSYAFDLPGHGTRESERVAGLGIMDYVADLKTVIEELAPVKPILIGHSMGGLIVQKFMENNDAPAAMLIAPCPAKGGSLWLPVKYFLHQPIAGTTAVLWIRTTIRSQTMCNRLFFDDISQERLNAHLKKLGSESSKAIRQMVIPFLKETASKITSTPVAVAAAGKDYFFGFKKLQKWTEKSGYDFLPFPEAAHNLICEPEEFNFGEKIYKWLEQKIKN